MIISPFRAPQPSLRSGCPASFGTLLGWCLPVFLTLAPAAQSQVFNPAKVIIIKADDFRVPTQAWTNFLTSSRNLGIKVGLGVVVESIVGNAAITTYLQDQQAMGDVEFWNHGWDHSKSPTNAFYEFKGTGLASQQTHFNDAQAGLFSATGRHATAFGPPYNQFDVDTVTIMNNAPVVRLFFTYTASNARTLGLVNRVATMGIIAEASTGNPVASSFIAANPNGPAGPVSLQFHPDAFSAADLAEYVQIIQFLQGKGYTFMLPAEYVAALAKTWTGATNGTWTTSGNWSPSGAPASGEDVAFDGTGTNLASNFNGIARSVNSLIVTSGQSAQVTITTTNAAPLTLAPSGAGGTWTTLNVAAGSHRFTGTDGGSAAAADFRFGGDNGTTHVLNIGGLAVFEIKGRIDNGGSTTNIKTFQKTGTGTLVFSGNSGSSGGWSHSLGSGFQIQQGVLRFAALNAGGFSGNNHIVSNGASLELDGGFNQGMNNGTYTLNGTGIAGNGALRSISGNNAVVGTGTGGINLATNSSIGVDTGSLTISQIIKGSGTLTKVGSGTLTLSGANTYSGATTVSGGTLALGNSNVLPATPVSLGAATLSVGAGFTETTGRLDALGAATLHLGNGSSAIAFADNGDLLAWSGTLNITGTFVSGTSLRCGTDASGLTGGQLAKITVNGSGSYSLNATGYLEATVGFASWITEIFANGTIPEGQRGPNQDFDNDGINNLIEYALAAKDPTMPDAPVGGFDGTTLGFTKRPGTSGLTYAIQESTDLGIGDDWTEVTGGSYVNDGDVISYVLPAGSGHSFLRLQVFSN